MDGKILDYEAKDILNAGKAQGISIGHMAQLTELVQKKLTKNKTIEQIAEELEVDVSTITEIIEKLG